MARTTRTSIGDLRHRVLVERPTRTPDSLGGATRTWAAVATLWARMTPVAGSESMIGEGLRSTETWIMRIRYRDDADTSWRVTWQGRVFNVKAVIDLEGKHQYLDLHLREGE